MLNNAVVANRHRSFTKSKSAVVILFFSKKEGGSNEFHGTALEFFRNDRLDAHGWTPTIGGVKTKVRFNLFGANIGGPIRKEKTFFFVKYEGERNRDGVIYQGILPTPQMQQGDFSNWQIDGIWNWRTGLPLTVSSAACGNCAMGSNRQIRADAAPGISPSLANPSASMWFNTAAFAPQNTPFGTVGRTTIWGPGLQQWDLSFGKNFRLSEVRYFQFRGELFNAFNHVNYSLPGSSVTTAGFGTITAALPGRNVQFGLKFHW